MIRLSLIAVPRLTCFFAKAAAANLGISSSLLSSRLKSLVTAGLLERRPYQTNPLRYEYLLTDVGRSLRPVIVALAAWGNAHLNPEQRSMVLVDASTGIEAEPVLVDRTTGRRADGPDFVFTAGPAASKPFRDRYASRPARRQPPGRTPDQLPLGPALRD